jgi:hypothetical protein
MAGRNVMPRDIHLGASRGVTAGCNARTALEAYCLGPSGGGSALPSSQGARFGGTRAGEGARSQLLTEYSKRTTVRMYKITVQNCDTHAMRVDRSQAPW